MKLLLLLSCLTLMVSVHAQNAKELAKEIMDSYAAHLEPAETLAKTNQMDAGKMIDAFMPYTSDEQVGVRREAFRMIHRMALRYGNASLQNKTIRLFVQSLDDKDATITSLLTGYLTKYTPTAFDKETRYLLSQRAKEKKRARDKIILLTGYLQITELVYDYRILLTDKTIKDKRIYMALQLAMARMGDSIAIKDLQDLSNKISINDDMVYDFCPNLAYTCQKKIYNFLFDIVRSDKRNCLSSNPDSEKPIICAFRVIESIAPYISDFPEATDSSGDVDIQDYPATLAKVRQWIAIHKENFEFNNGRY